MRPRESRSWTSRPEKIDRSGERVRERWLGATGRKVPEIAVEGELELPADVLVLDDSTWMHCRRRTRGPAGRGARRHGAGREAALARPEVACVLVPPGSARCSTSTSASSRMGDAGRRDLLDRRVRPRARGSGGSPSSRSSSPSAPSSRGRSRTSARSRRSRTRTRATARTGSPAPPGPPGRRGRRAADRRGRGPRAAAARRRRRPAGGAATLHRRGLPRLGGRQNGDGYAAQGNILVSEATVDGLADTFERDRRAGRSRSGCSTASTRPRLRAATVAASSRRACSWSRGTAATRPLRRPRRPARGRPRAPARGAPPALRPPRGAVRQDAEGRVGRGRRRARRRAGERLARLGFEGDLAETLARWAGSENLEERIDGVERLDPVVLEALRGA